MNAVTEEIDPVWERLDDEHRKIAKMANAYVSEKGKILPYVKDMLMMGADMQFSSNLIYLNISGDKQKFLRIWNLQRRHGIKPSAPAKGDTSAYWYAFQGDCPVFVQFTSTQCRRVQVGTEMKSVPIYETKCEEFAPSQEELAAPLQELLPAASNEDPGPTDDMQQYGTPGEDH